MLTASERSIVLQTKSLLTSRPTGSASLYLRLGQLLAIIDRLDALANEGLTEGEKRYIETTDPAYTTRIRIFVKLQARAVLNAGIASDALEERGLERLEERERWVAGECAAMVQQALSCMDWSPTYDTVMRDTLANIRRRFGLTEPARQEAEPAGEERSLCPECHGQRRTRICFRGPGDDRESDYVQCPACDGSGVQEARTP